MLLSLCNSIPHTRKTEVAYTYEERKMRRCTSTDMCGRKNEKKKGKENRPRNHLATTTTLNNVKIMHWKVSRHKQSFELFLYIKFAYDVRELGIGDVVQFMCVFFTRWWVGCLLFDNSWGKHITFFHYVKLNRALCETKIKVTYSFLREA